MVEIELRLYAGLRAAGCPAPPGGPSVLVVEEGTTLEGLLARLGIPREAVALSFVNGLAQPLDDVLRDRDRVGLFPPVGGG